MKKMKNRILFCLVMITVGYAANAQDRSIKMDVSIGSAMTLGEVKAYGISAAVEPKFFFNKRIAAGLRLEGDVLFGGKIEAEAQNVDVQMTSRAAQLLKGEYYFTGGKTRPFIGVMGGRYTQANIGSSSEGSATIKAGVYYGFAPELGVTFNNFRMSAMYHFIPGTDLVTVSTGTPIEVERNYFVFTMGFKAFQFNLK
jgi:hypothetical protein